MAKDLKEAETLELMAEAKSLHDLIYNIECYGTSDMLRLEHLYAEFERRGISVVEGHTVEFIEHTASQN